MLAKHENVYADFTINPNAPGRLLTLLSCAYENKVMDKLLFGSGFPLGRADRCIEILLGFNRLLAGKSADRAEVGDSAIF